jgi:hypothetical protein
MPTTAMPAPEAVGPRAVQIIDLIRGDEQFAALRRSSLKYADCWSTYTGYPLVASWNLDSDAPPLFDEGLKVLALKAAVFDATSDDIAAELLVSPPVDEMVHAIIAQAGLTKRIFDRLGITCVHQTDHEEFGWNPGDYTQQCYQAAGWGTPPVRYWLAADETLRRRAMLNDRYATIGIERDGRRHSIDFTQAEPELVAA